MPERSCIGCRMVHEKDTLVRLSVDGEGNLTVDRKKTMEGRGAYLCPRRSCYDEAAGRGRGGLHGAFRRPVVLGDGEKLWRDIASLPFMVGEK